MWHSRIVRRGEADPRSLKSHPRNWRLHPAAQAQAVSEVLALVGWVKGIIVNERSGYLLDGHLRVEEAIKAGIERVPVKYVDLDEAEETLILTTFDAITRMAHADAAALDRLLQSLSSVAAPIQSLLDELAGKGAAISFDKGSDYVRPDRPLPDTQARVGTYIFKIPRAVFLVWEEQLRQAVGFNANDIATEIMRRLGFETCSN